MVPTRVGAPVLVSLFLLRPHGSFLAAAAGTFVYRLHSSGFRARDLCMGRVREGVPQLRDARPGGSADAVDRALSAGALPRCVSVAAHSRSHADAGGSASAVHSSGGVGPRRGDDRTEG